MNAKLTWPVSLLFCAALAVSAPAFAAKPQKEKKEKVVRAVSPSQDTVDIPIAESPAVAATEFPALPPSNPCNENNIVGLYRLVAVYEDPHGKEAYNFSIMPNQYLRFDKNKTYARANMDRADMSIQAINQSINGHTPALLQYVLQKNGFVYFYQNSVAIDVQACFVVASNLIPFRAGQILFMPPKGQIQGRLVKVYERAAGGANRAQATNANSDENANEEAAEKKPAAKKRRGKRRPKFKFKTPQQ